MADSIDRRPSLEFQIALNICAQHAYHNGGQVLILDTDQCCTQALCGRLRNSAACTPKQDFPPADTIIWPLPDDDIAQTLTRIQVALSTTGELLLIVPGRLSRFLPGIKPASKSLYSELARAGFHITEQVGFHGLASIGWSLVYRFFKRINRDDLASRSLQRMRQAYAARLTTLSTVTVVHAIARRQERVR